MARKGKPSLPLQKKYVMQVRRLMPSGIAYYRKDFTTKALADFLHHLPVGQPNRYQAALSRFAKFLIQRGILNANPLDHVERAAENPARLFELSHEEVGRLLSALPEQDRPWHALMAATGVEWGAIASAQVRDLDPDALTFRAKGTKTRHRDRTVMIRKGPEASLIRAYWKRLNALPAAPLFRLTGHRTALQRLQDAAKAVGLPKMRIHDWRHVFAVQAVRDGVPYHIIAHQLGHSNTIMVQKVYGRFAVTLDDLRAVEHSEMHESVTSHLTLEA
jgi:integrase